MHEVMLIVNVGVTIVALSLNPASALTNCVDNLQDLIRRACMVLYIGFIFIHP